MVDREHIERYERVARHLDGAGGPLSPEEARLAEEIRSDQAWLAERMDAEVPDAVLLRVGARMKDAPPPQSTGRPRLWPRVLRAAGAVAAAAAVVLVVVLPSDPPPPPTTQAPLTIDEQVEAYVSTGEPTGFAVAADLLDEQMGAMLTELRLEDEPVVQMKIDAVDEGISTFWLDPISLELGEEPSL